MFTVKITPNDKGSPAGKLADAELHFVATEHTCPACNGSGEVVVAHIPRSPPKACRNWHGWSSTLA